MTGILQRVMNTLLFNDILNAWLTIYNMTGPPRLMTILLRNLPGVLAFLIFVVLLRFSKKLDISRKQFILASLILTAIVFVEDILLMLLFMMFSILLLG